MLHYEQVFGKVKGEQVITLQMGQQLKTKNINVVQNINLVLLVDTMGWDLTQKDLIKLNLS